MLDPILSEIRQIRDAFSDKYHGDVTAMLAALRATGDASGRKTVTLSVCPDTRRVGTAHHNRSWMVGSAHPTEGMAFAYPDRHAHPTLVPTAG